MINIFTNIKINLFLWALVCSGSLFAQNNVEIWQIQGQDNRSPYEGQTVSTQNNIITFVADDFFVIQTPDERADESIETSNAILVIANSQVKEGDMVSLQGTIFESNGGTTILEAFSNSIQITSTGNPLPEAILIDNAYPLHLLADVSAWEWLEAMRIDLQNFTITAPSSDGISPYVSPTMTRPFREPGIKFSNTNDALAWDGNPEVIPFHIEGFGLPSNPDIGAGMHLTGQAMVFGDTHDHYIYPINYQLYGDYIQRRTRSPIATEATIGCINALFLLQDEFNYTQRIQKTGRYILEQMQSPDIIAFQEVGGLNVLQDISDWLKNEDSELLYTPILRQGSGSIHTGFLVKNTVTVEAIRQLGENESLSIGGRVHDRPPLLLEAQLNTNPPTPIAVLNVHLRSLNGIESSDNFFVRTKRHEAAISVAEKIYALQQQYHNIVVVGDFNAFQFSDGYVDVVNQIAGTPSLGAQFSPEMVLETPLINYSLTVPTEEQYSYVFRGNAQILDHCLASADMTGMQVNELQYVRGNADNPPDFLNDHPTLRISDHDGFVLYLGLEDSLTTTETITSSDQIQATISYPNPFRNGSELRFNLSQKQNLQYKIITLDGKIVQQGNLGSIQNENITLDLHPNLGQQMYILKIEGNQLNHINKLFISQ